MDRLRIGRSVRALRIRGGLRQIDLADAARLSRSNVARIEWGDVLRLPLGDLVAVTVVLGADLDVIVRWRGEGLDRLLDAAHATLVDQIVRLLEAAGWEVAVEVSFSIDGERGSIDVLGWHAATATLLVVEVKSVVPDVQAMLVTHDRKVRLAPRIALARGWQARHIGRLLVIGDTSAARSRVRGVQALFEASYPDRVVEVRRWLRDPAGVPRANDGARGGSGSRGPGGPARPLAGLLFLRYAQGMSSTASVVPRQRIRKRDRPGRSASTFMGDGSSERRGIAPMG